ncbi:MAG: response regulator [Hyphomonadaceae bacterium]|nr:response regulator [Hyphomonadaceae bacterium]
MRLQPAKVDDWLFGQDDNLAAGETAEDAFDSFGPISDIRRALQRPSHHPVAQGPHDFTRILVAEGDAYHRRVLRVLLASPRISAIEVEDGQAAVDLLALRSFDLLVLDMDLAQLNGAEVIRWVRRSLTPWADIPILGLLNDKHRHEAGKLMSIGMTDWTTKPLSRHHLADKIVHLLPGLYDAGL